MLVHRFRIIVNREVLDYRFLSYKEYLSFYNHDTTTPSYLISCLHFTEL